MQSPHSPMHRFVHALFKRKFLIGAVCTALLVPATAYIVTTPNTYTAESSLLVKFGREYVYQGDVGQSVVAPSYNQQEIINSLTEIMRTWQLTDKVVRDLTPVALYPKLSGELAHGLSPEGAAILEFGRDLNISATPRSNVIRLQYKNISPDMASKALNALVDRFKAKHLELYGEQKAAFLDGEQKRFREALTKADGELDAYRRENDIHALAEQQLLLLREQSDFQTKSKANDGELISTVQRLANIQEQLKTLSPIVEVSSVDERSQSARQIESELTELRLREQSLANRFGDQHPDLVRVREAISKAQGLLSAQSRRASGNVVRGANPVYEALQREAITSAANRDALAAMQAELKRQTEEIGKQLSVLSAKRNRLEDLERVREEAASNYKLYQTKAEEARLSEDMDRNKITSVAVVQEAAPPLRADRPGKAAKLAIVWFLVCSGAVALALAVEYASKRLSGRFDTERELGVPVLATMPETRGT